MQRAGEARGESEEGVWVVRWWWCGGRPGRGSEGGGGGGYAPAAVAADDATMRWIFAAGMTLLGLKTVLRP